MTWTGLAFDIHSQARIIVLVDIHSAQCFRSSPLMWADAYRFLPWFALMWAGAYRFLPWAAQYTKVFVVHVVHA